MHHQLLSARRLVLAQTRETPETFENVFGYREASVSYFLRGKQREKKVSTILLLLIVVLNKNVGAGRSQDFSKGGVTVSKQGLSTMSKISSWHFRHLLYRVFG